MEWSNTVVLRFLDLYEGEPVIWNPSHELHKSRCDVHDAWRRIQEKLGDKYSVTDIKKKKESLMATFRSCLNKVRQSVKNGGEPYKPNWFCYQKMQRFLKVRHRSVPNPDGFTCQQESEANGADGNESCSDEDITFETRSESSDFLKEEVQFTPISIPCNFKAPVQKKRRLSEVDQLQQSLEATCSNDMDKPTAVEDECGLYGQLIAIKLRRLHERARDVAMNRIDNLLFDLKYSHDYPQQSAPNIQNIKVSPREPQSPSFFPNSPTHTIAGMPPHQT